MVAATLSRHGSSTVVHYTGRCEAWDALDFLEPIVRALRENVRMVIVDLSAISAMCPSCVDALIKGRQAAERYHSTVALASPSDACLRELEAAHALDLFPIE